MTCSQCQDVVKARGLCARHYMAWYRVHHEEVRRNGTPPRASYWRFTAKHWWSWWEKRAIDARTRELRAGIQEFRASLDR